MSTAVHEKESPSTRPLSYLGEAKGSNPLLLQLRARAFLRLPRTLPDGREVSSKVETFALAIAIAEGYFLKGSIPNRCANPGDLKGTSFPAQVGVCRGGHAKFRNEEAGWTALYHQIEKIQDGTSTKYTPRATFRQVARTYAQNYRPWLKIVTKTLEVDDDDEVGQFLSDYDKIRVTYLAQNFDFTDMERWTQ